jgi:hypothetical protein
VAGKSDRVCLENISEYLSMAFMIIIFFKSIAVQENRVSFGVILGFLNDYGLLRLADYSF